MISQYALFLWKTNIKQSTGSLGLEDKVLIALQQSNRKVSGKEGKETFSQKMSTTQHWKSAIHTDKILLPGNNRLI